MITTLCVSATDRQTQGQKTCRDNTPGDALLWVRCALKINESIV